jgi:hypothetical protein
MYIAVTKCEEEMIRRDYLSTEYRIDRKKEQQEEKGETEKLDEGNLIPFLTICIAVAGVFALQVE